MKRASIFLLSLFLVAVIICRIPTGTVYAYSARGMCVIEKDSGRVIFSENKDAKLPMASTTKVVTAITVLDNCDNLDEIIVVNPKSIGIEGTSIYLRHGEEISVRDLLYGLMLRSGNDAAMALAFHVGGSVENFANMMNNTAKKVGANNSNFKNPHGLHDDEHYTTAYDLAKITAYALNNPIFKEIVSTKSYQIDATNKSDVRYLKNKNKLLSSLDGCCGVKTGFTKKAGRCLVSACERDDITYVCVVLNCGPMFEESSELLNRCFNEYKCDKIIDKSKEIYNEYIIDKQNGRLYLYTDEDFYYPLTDEERSRIKIEYSVDLNNKTYNEVAGEIRILLDNHLIKTLKLYTINKIDKLIDDDAIKNIQWEEGINEN